MKHSTLIKIMNILEPALERGLELRVGKDCVDVNTGMKSHCYLQEEDDKIVAFCRYGVKEGIENYTDLLLVVDACWAGRDYANSIWFNILRPEGHNS